MPKHVDFTGEKAINSDGYEMVVIECPNAHNMTIQFTADGLIRRHIYHADFVKGKVRHAVETQDMVGLRRQMKNGSWCEIVSAKSYECCEIVFESGYKTITAFDRFIRGEVGDGSRCTKYQAMTGTHRTSRGGEEFTVLSEYEKDGEKLCDIEFPNGEIKTYHRCSVTKNAVSSDEHSHLVMSAAQRKRNENRPYTGCYSVRESEEQTVECVKTQSETSNKAQCQVEGSWHTSRGGEEFTVLSTYKKDGKKLCDVQFANGEVKTYSAYSVKKKAVYSEEYKHAALSVAQRKRAKPQHAQSENRVTSTEEHRLTGTWRTSVCGEKFTVISEYKTDSGKWCDIRFENGEVKTYSRGSVLRNMVSSKEHISKVHSDAQRKRLYGDSYYTNSVNVCPIVSLDGSVWTINKEYERGKYVDATNQFGHIVHKVRPGNLRRKNNPAITTYGEQFIAKSGEICTIIGGEMKGDLTIKTDDGTIYYHQQYCKLKNGVIAGRGISFNTVAKNRYRAIGQTVMQNIGMNATCIEYEDNKNVRVRFENGEIVQTTSYDFFRGLVVPQSLEKSKRMSLNEFTLLSCLEPYGFIHAKSGSLKDVGLKNYEIDIYHPGLKIAIEYDGCLHGVFASQKRDNQKDELCKAAGIDIYRVRECDAGLLSDGIAKEFLVNDYHHFGPEIRDVFCRLIDAINKEHNLNIKAPNLTDPDTVKDIREKFYNNVTYLSKVGEQRVNAQGHVMTLIAYRGVQDCDVEFDNGYIATHRYYSVFKSGKIKCEENHYGEVFRNWCGEEMIIISDRFGQTVDIEFEDGTVRHNVKYFQLKKGVITNPNTDSREVCLAKHIGETVLCKNGMVAEIVEIFRGKNRRAMVYAKFEDGTISKATAYPHFKLGYVRHPSIFANSEMAYQLRKDKGLPEAEALKWYKNFTVYDHLGNMYPSKKALCEAYRVNQSTFARREKCGWTLEECLLGRNQENIP